MVTNLTFNLLQYVMAILLAVLLTSFFKMKNPTCTTQKSTVFKGEKFISDMHSGCKYKFCGFFSNLNLR